MQIENGNVVVIRDGDYVVACYYRKFYKSVSELADEVINYLNTKKPKNPNFSFMQINEKKFLPLEMGCDFYNEFDFFVKIFNNPMVICPKCGNLLFVYPDSPNSYCHNCKFTS